MEENFSLRAKEITSLIVEEARRYRIAVQEYREFSDIESIQLRISKLIAQLTKLVDSIGK